MDFNERFKAAVRDNFNRSTQDYLKLEEDYGFFDALTAALVAQAGLTDPMRQEVKTVLDVGCGTGSSTARLQAMFPEAAVVGIDLSEKMIAAAEENYPELDFVCGDAENLDQYFPPALFDFIVFPASLFLMPTPQKVLVAAEKLLTDGGVVSASLLQGLKEKDNLPVCNLPEFKGIIKNQGVSDLFSSLFDQIVSEQVAIELDSSLLAAIYRIEALSAGAFQGKTREERDVALQKLLREVATESLVLVQQWLFITGYKKKM